METCYCVCWSGSTIDVVWRRLSTTSDVPNIPAASVRCACGAAASPPPDNLLRGTPSNALGLLRPLIMNPRVSKLLTLPHQKLHRVPPLKASTTRIHRPLRLDSPIAIRRRLVVERRDVREQGIALPTILHRAIPIELCPLESGRVCAPIVPRRVFDTALEAEGLVAEKEAAFREQSDVRDCRGFVPQQLSLG